MKATGIVRNIDDLGRVVIPREIRNQVHIKDGDAIEFFLEDNLICLQRYRADSPDVVIQNNIRQIQTALKDIEDDEIEKGVLSLLNSTLEVLSKKIVN